MDFETFYQLLYSVGLNDFYNNIYAIALYDVIKSLESNDFSPVDTKDNHEKVSTTVESLGSQLSEINIDYESYALLMQISQNISIRDMNVRDAVTDLHSTIKQMTFYALRNLYNNKNRNIAIRLIGQLKGMDLYENMTPPEVILAKGTSPLERFSYGSLSLEELETLLPYINSYETAVLELCERAGALMEPRIDFQVFLLILFLGKAFWI